MIAFGMPGGTEWLVILLIVLIFFGAGRLPDVMSQFGKGIRAFKDGAKDADPDDDEEVVIRKKKRPAVQLPDPDEQDDLDGEVEARARTGAARRKSTE